MNTTPGPRHPREAAPRPVHPDVDLAQVDRVWATMEAAEEPSMSVDEILDRNYYETVSSYDPSARLSRWLNLAVVGDQVRAGSLDINIAEDLLRAFSMELDGAATAQGVTDGPKVELAGVSRGSAILHLVPTLGEDIPRKDQMPIVTDRLDEMLERITELHDIAEAEGDLRQFARATALLKGLHELTAALDRYDLELRLQWRSGTGRHRQSALTTRARSHVRRQWEDQTESEVMRVSGRVVSMDIGGTFDVKTTTGKNRRYVVHVGGEEELLRLRLNLGDMIHITVRVETKVNRLGLTGPLRYNFLRFTGNEPTLDNE